jgi:hypothetical protein
MGEIGDVHHFIIFWFKGVLSLSHQTGALSHRTTDRRLFERQPRGKLRLADCSQTIEENIGK